MEPWSYEIAGRIDEHVVESVVLKGNPLGDPDQRPLWVYLPPGYDDDPDHRYPSIYAIQGLTGQLDMWRNRFPFRRNFPELVDELFAADGSPQALVVFVDAWTSLGGSQFIDSPGTGRYGEYLCEEVVSLVDSRYRTLAEPGHRGITGKSSGGYGAMVVPMLRPDVFGALASHAGDALFEACYMPEFPKTARQLRDEFDASWDTFFAQPPKWETIHLLETYGYAAAYSPDPAAPGRALIPFDAHGHLLDDVWAQWLEKDPVRMAPAHAEALRSMKRIYLDAGKKDEFYLDLGAQAFGAELDKLGVAYTLELFDGTHARLTYRYPGAIRELVVALTA
jgi:enterochelin esterase-like enzyme